MVVPEGLRIFTLAERPDLESKVRSLPDTFPELMHHDAAVNRYWDSLFTDFSGFQIAVCEGDDEIVAAGHCIPFFWDGTTKTLPGGLDEVLERGGEISTGSPLRPWSRPSWRSCRTPTGEAVSATWSSAKSVAAGNGLEAMIAPARPTMKDRYPLTPMERYVRWKRPDGLPFEPWLRVHSKLGAEFLRVAPGSMVITGTIAEWEEWTGLYFPESDAYVVPGALYPVVMDLERDLGLYEEPNVWMRHPFMVGE